MISNISDIIHSFYINLESRPDRKKHVEEQLKIIGIQANRFNAIKLPNGALGCSMSHLKCLEIAKENDWEHILIVEDDIKFLNPKLFIIQLNKFLFLHSEWDVILVAGNNLPPHEVIDDSCVKVKHCQTTTGYIVKKHYYNTLIENIRSGITHLIKEPNNHYLYAIDKYWVNLQQRDNWFLITPLTVTQRVDYSDIEKRPTNYTRVMTDLTKEWLVQPNQNNNMNYKPPISLSKINFSI
jgi:glycosyl transferase family 25